MKRPRFTSDATWLSARDRWRSGRITFTLIAALVAVHVQRAPAADRPYETLTLRGKVAWVGDVLKRQYGITTEPQTAESMVMLESPTGEVYPIVPDVRGRAFMVDKRLREIDLELLVRRYEGSPLVQVIRVFKLAKDGKYELDYWCDICAITMFIEKDCECCQAPNRLRERLVSDAPAEAKK